MHAKILSDRLNDLLLHVIIFLAKEILGWGGKASLKKKNIEMSTFQSPSKSSITIFNTSEETSYWLSFHRIQNLDLFLQKTVVSHLKRWK